MIKLLIADDEPLVCVGVQSLLPWEEHGIEIVGTARNGQQAAEMIEELRPDIVISDIKMPLKSGLDLAKECGERYGRIPLFIMLTSFEEFDLVRRAINYQAVDYLIKLELDAASLQAAIDKAKAILDQVRQAENPAGGNRGRNMQVFREKFFLRLINNFFDSDEQYAIQVKDLGIDFSYAAYAVGMFELVGPDNAPPNGDRLFSLCNSSVQMARETLGKFVDCHVVMLDMRHFSVIFCIREEMRGTWREHVREALDQTGSLLQNYFGVAVQGAVGCAVAQPRQMNVSYHTAQQGVHKREEAEKFAFYDEAMGEAALQENSLLYAIGTEIRKAFEEVDAAALYESLTEISGQLASRPDHFIQAMDTASNILYMAISILPNGMDTVWRIFDEEPEGYRILYRLNTVDAIAAWLLKLRDECCELLQNQRQNYKHQVVAKVQAYIQDNLEKKLTLNEVAAVFNFNPSYLSQLFAKYSGEGFVEYITHARVAAAKELLLQGDRKIYEIAEKLGFENSFYFSKVFKKVEGVSPREYIQRQQPDKQANEEEM